MLMTDARTDQSLKSEFLIQETTKRVNPSKYSFRKFYLFLPIFTYFLPILYHVWVREKKHRIDNKLFYILSLYQLYSLKKISGVAFTQLFLTLNFSS